MSRTRAVAGALVAAALLGVGLATRWPSSAPALDCPGGQVHLDPAGIATCGVGTLPPAGQAHTLRQRSALNAATTKELALLPGISDGLAAAIVAERERLGGFTSWAQVDAVEGVGPARLQQLQADFALPSDDAGVW